MTNPLLDVIGKQFDKAIVPTLQAQTIGKKLIPINGDLSGKGLGVLTVKTMRYVARAEASNSYDIQQDIEDTVDVDSIDTRIPVQQDDVKIKRRDWDAYALQKIPLENDLAIDMAGNIALKQTTIVVDGWKPTGSYKIKGMYQVAGNSVEATSFDAFKGAIKTFAACVTKLKTSKIYSQGYNAVVASDIMAELEASCSDAGIQEMDLALNILNRAAPAGSKPGQIYESPDLADGTGFVAPIASQENLRYFDLIETQQPKNHLWFDNGNEQSGDVYVRQLAALVPRFKHLNKTTLTDPCVCKFTGA